MKKYIAFFPVVLLMNFFQPAFAQQPVPALTKEVALLENELQTAHQNQVAVAELRKIEARLQEKQKELRQMLEPELKLQGFDYLSKTCFEFYPKIKNDAKALELVIPGTPDAGFEAFEQEISGKAIRITGYVRSSPQYGRRQCGSKTLFMITEMKSPSYYFSREVDTKNTYYRGKIVNRRLYLPVLLNSDPLSETHINELELKAGQKVTIEGQISCKGVGMDYIVLTNWSVVE